MARFLGARGLVPGVLCSTFSVAIAACDARPVAPPPAQTVVPAPVQAPAPLPAGGLLGARGAFEGALYFTPEPRIDPDAALASACAPLAASFARAEFDGPPPAVPALATRRVPVAQYAPPDESHCHYFAHGLSPERVAALQGSGNPFVLRFSAPAAQGAGWLRRGDELLACVADATGGLVWDEDTREVFTVAVWRTDRLDQHWRGDVPEPESQIVIHTYQEGERVRAITLGMAKLALPDVVIDDIVADDISPARELIVLVCQAIARGAQPVDGKLRIRSASGVEADLVLTPGRPEEGDPRNRLLEIVFADATQGTVHQQQTAVFDRLFGARPDKLSMARAGDAELEAASARARLALPGVAERFRAGLPGGAQLHVKAPFEAGEGREYMWIEVRSWVGDTISGVLVSPPVYVPLRRGASVRVEAGSVFDYAIRHADGTIEGNETTRILERRQQP